jgi:hypothetical protein
MPFISSLELELELELEFEVEVEVEVEVDFPSRPVFASPRVKASISIAICPPKLHPRIDSRVMRSCRRTYSKHSAYPRIVYVSSGTAALSEHPWPGRSIARTRWVCVFVLRSGVVVRRRCHIRVQELLPWMRRRVGRVGRVGRLEVGV